MSKKNTNHSDMTTAGYVYILTNESFREDWIKIGKSSRPVDIRSRELDNTAVPLPFKIFATLQTKKYHQVESLVHKTIDRLSDFRIRQNREFFNIHPEVALDIFRDIASTIDDAVVTLYRDNLPVPAEKAPQQEVKVRHHKKRFRFSMVDIPIGAELVFVPTGIKVKVATDNMIEYQIKADSTKCLPLSELFSLKRNKFPPAPIRDRNISVTTAFCSPNCVSCMLKRINSDSDERTDKPLRE